VLNVYSANARFRIRGKIQNPPHHQKLEKVVVSIGGVKPIR